jgi:glycine dehydrogenase subunit 2
VKTIFEKSSEGRQAVKLPKLTVQPRELISKRLLRSSPAELPELPEIEVVRHYTLLSRMNYSVDSNFYPLGSCTMKYNPKACEVVARFEGFTDLHPLLPQLRGGGQLAQGALRLIYEFERMLSELTGMAEFTLQPLAGAHGELTGAMIIAAYHKNRGAKRTKILIPDSAHGTNPASAALAGFEVIAVPSNKNGTVDVEKLKTYLSNDVAGMMMTNPNTLGVFEPQIKDIAALVHQAGGLLYYDGANLNAVIGRCKIANMGFDLCHLNLHKTFATPHGGGGPGAGPVGVVEKLRPYLPISRVAKTKDGMYSLDYDYSESIGYVAPFYGNFGVILKAYMYCLMLGKDGLKDVSNHAVLNANYVMEKLRTKLPPATQGRCMHECVLSAKHLADNYDIRAMDVAKALLDRGFHAPTVYFPLIVPEALMIEPTETETKETLDEFIAAMKEILDAAEKSPDALKKAPEKTPLKRVDEVLAARNMKLVF